MMLLQAAFSGTLKIYYLENLTPIKSPKILCWITTIKENHETKAAIVKKTWCFKCDKCIFISSEADVTLPAVRLNITEGRDYLWGKTKTALNYIYNHYTSYEWYLKADDDTYVIVENLKFKINVTVYTLSVNQKDDFLMNIEHPTILRYFLYNQSCEEPVYFGGRLDAEIKNGYMSGGAGYVLSRYALKKFVTEGLPDRNNCAFYNKLYEDVELARCLEKIGVQRGESRDVEKKHRFLAESPEALIAGDDNWLRNWTFYPMGAVCVRHSTSSSSSYTFN
ncbi:unnamed protein product [Enterobius vermicularis]|uniref:N-acetylgalactosaminide beta-1,3-galactosyltransferase n=1 Tax=Enterobius vermicularis TaxID=51028 RepID=A0A0N4VPF5_ENTVE|nr:unnamed protein product [Enterobius vermicularis]